MNSYFCHNFSGGKNLKTMPFVVAMGDGCFSMEEWLDLVQVVEERFLVSGVYDLGLEWTILHL